MEIYNSNYNSELEDSRILLEQYRNLSNIIEKTTSRRININGFFIGVLTTVITFVGFLNRVETDSYNSIVMVSVFLYIVSVVWQISIRTYMTHNQTYYQIMSKIESGFPVKYYEFEKNVIKDVSWLVSISNKEILLNYIFGVSILALGTHSYIINLKTTLLESIGVILVVSIFFVLVNLVISRVHRFVSSKLNDAFRE